MSRRREGFTLLEIMFALVAGLIAISVVYALNNGSTRILAEQNRVATTQTALRLAMEQIRSDIERAGFLVSPTNAGQTVCGTAAFQVRAIDFTNSGSIGAVPNATAHRVDADRLRLMGNYVTSGSYMVGTIADATGSTIALQTTWQSFRRDFTTPSGTTDVMIDANAFARVFPSGTNARMLHIETNDHHHVYTYVSGRNASTTAGPSPSATLSISPPMVPGGLCVIGLAGGATVTPINRIEYAIVDPTNAANGLLALVRTRTGETTTSRALIEGIPSVLVRREIDANGAPIPGTTRVVLEFAVEFDLRFDLDTTSGPDVAPTLSLDQATFGTSPQQVRAVRVRLSARTPDAEPNLGWVARGQNEPLTRYYARDTTPVAGLPSSRVRTLTSTIFVPNIAYADMP